MDSVTVAGVEGGGHVVVTVQGQLEMVKVVAAVRKRQHRFTFRCPNVLPVTV